MRIHILLLAQSFFILVLFHLHDVGARPESEQPTTPAPPPASNVGNEKKDAPAPSPAEKEKTQPTTPGTADTVKPQGPAPKSVNDGIQRTDDITKSKSDPRSYRFVMLKNGLQLLLISDENADMSAASVAVNAGWLCDVREIQGSAHYLEHMLFMGSEKFPKEDEYSVFISDHSGFTNAYTDKDITNYYFEVSPDALQGAVDRIAQFFLKPLLLQSSLEREAQAVESEYQMHFAEDNWRFYLLLASLSKKDHPFNEFYIGSYETLYTIPKEKGINVREVLITQLFEVWYSSNIINACLYGKESLDDLEKMAAPLFENVVNRNVAPLNFKFPDEHPWGPQQLGQKIFAVPVADDNTLDLIFAVPNVLSQYKTGPDYFTSFLIGYSGPGSLISALKKKNYISIGDDYTCTSYEGQAGFGFYHISFQLTPEAIDLKANIIDEIIMTIFQYIQLCKLEGVQEWIFKEVQRVGELAFLYKDLESKPSSYITSLTTAMPTVPIKDILTYSYLSEVWDAKLIEDFMSFLRPENMNVLITSQSFADITDQTEQWFQTAYKLEKIPDDLLKKWSAPELNPDLQLPKPNELLPDNLDLLPPDEGVTKLPVVIQESELSRFFLLQDTEFKQPKLRVVFEILSPIGTASAENRNLMEIYATLFSDSMQEYSYIASNAGLSWSICTSDYGFQLEFYGYSQKMSLFLEKVLSQLTVFKIDEIRLQNLKEAYIRDLNNFETSDMEIIAESYLMLMIREKTFHTHDRLKCVDALNRDSLEKFRKEFFQTIFIQGFLHGNCNKEKGMEIVNIVENTFKGSKGASTDQIASLRIVELQESADVLLEKPNKFRPNSFFYGYFQISETNIRDQTFVELLVQILKQPMFDQLRTKEQLGYYVTCYSDYAYGVIAFVIVLEGDQHPVLFNSRVKEFISSMQKTLEAMKDEDFEVEKQSLAHKYSIKPKNLLALSDRLYSEIATQFYVFDRLEQKANELKTIKKADVIEYYKKITAEKRQLNIYVISDVTKPEIPKDCPLDECTKIADPYSFQKEAKFCPYVAPCNNMQPLGCKAAGAKTQAVEPPPILQALPATPSPPSP